MKHFSGGMPRIFRLTASKVDKVGTHLSGTYRD